MNIRKTIAPILAIVAFSSLAVAAYAGGPGDGTTVLPANGTPVTLPIGLSSSSETLLKTTGSESLTQTAGTGTLAGSVVENIYQNTVSKLLTFTYQFSVTPSSSSSPTHFTAADFGSWVTAVGQAASGGTVSAYSADNSLGAVDFNFLGGKFSGGATSYLLVITTNALTYGAGTILVQDGAQAAANGYAAAPEPATIAAFAITALGIMLMMLSARRKQTVNQLT